jgi:hypothetical protein
MNKLFSFILVFYAFFLFTCGEKIHEFSGFTKAQLEYLLAGDSANVWLRTGRWEDGTEVEFTACEKNNRLIFMPATSDDEKKLLYNYDTLTCDSTGFCIEYPAYCLSDTTLCNSDPEFCALLAKGTLYIATWEVTGVPEDYEITDQLRLNFPGFSNFITVKQISSGFLEWEYSDTAPGIGQPVTIKETFERIE